MCKIQLFKKKCEINNKKLLYTIFDNDLTCCIDPDPVQNPVVYGEYVRMKHPVNIDVEEDVKKEKKL
jgi:hypothetical protein